MVASSSNAQSDELSRFLTARRKQGKAVHTHTRFDGGRVSTLSIPRSDVPELQKLLFSYVGDKSDRVLGEGPNAITEKVRAGEPFRFFVDLDFKLSQVEEMSQDEVIAAMKEFIRGSVQIVQEAAGVELSRVIVARRLLFKLHLHFPDLVVTKDTAIPISSAIARKMRDHPLYQEDVLDQSVYSTGLRMLYCHKGAMLSKGGKQDGDLRDDILDYEMFFGKGSYQHVYEVIDIDSFEKVTDRGIKQIQDTSIFPAEGQAVATVTLSEAQEKAKGKGKVKGKRTGGTAMIVAGPSSVKDSEVPPHLRSFVESRYAVTLNGSMKTYQQTQSLALSTSNQQVCPFIQRSHRGNNVYIYVDSKGMTERCHDSECKGKSHGLIPFADYPSEVKMELQQLVAVTYQKEEKMEAISREMQRLRKDYPRNSFHIDPTQSSIDALGAKIKLADLYCPKCEKEHDDPQTFLECNPAGQVVLGCFEDFFTPGYPLTSMPQEVTNMLFQGFIQININHTVNNFDGSDKLTGQRDFGAFEDFPRMYTDEEINRLCYKSMAGDTYSVAKFLSRIVKEDAVFVDGSWYTYTGRYWRQCEPSPFFAEKVVGIYETLMTHYKQEAQRKWLQSIVNDLSNIERRRPFMRELEGILDFMGENIRLDPNTTLVCFPNGVYDTETCTFRAHRKEDYITHSLHYDFPSSSDPEIRASIMSLFQSILPDKATRDFLLLFLALHLEGRNRHQIAVILSGSGGNGKGVLKALMKVVFGDLHAEPVSAFLTSERPSDEKPSPGLLDLRVKRAVVASEPGAGKKINGAFLKFISGGDLVRCRACNSNKMVEYMPRFIPTLLCNTIPLIDCGSTEVRSLWRRLRIIHFPQQFVSHDGPLAENEEREDPGMANRILSWGPEMMLLLTEVFEAYVKDGRRLIEPPSVVHTTEEEKLRNNPFARFLSIVGRKQAGTLVHVHRVKDRYIEWLQKHDEVGDKTRPTTHSIGKRLQELQWRLGEPAALTDCTTACIEKRTRAPTVHNLHLLPDESIVTDFD